MFPEDGGQLDYHTGSVQSPIRLPPLPKKVSLEALPKEDEEYEGGELVLLMANDDDETREV
jgi:hypothetical protein